MELEKEIKQSHFKNLYIKGYLNLIYTGNWLMSRSYHMLKPYDISPQQYNVLRILRGKHPETSSLSDIQERMLDKMSNSTRLVEKLKQKGYLTRDACLENRRKVDIHITCQGLTLLETIDLEIEKVENVLANSLNDSEIQLLNDFCDRIRE